MAPILTQLLAQRGQLPFDHLLKGKGRLRVNLRHSPGVPPTSEAGGRPGEIGTKADVGLERRLSAELGITDIPPPYLCGTL